MSTTTGDRQGNWMSIAQAADRLGVAPRTIRRMISRGELTGYRVGNTRLLRVDAAEVERSLTVVPAASAGSGVG